MTALGRRALLAGASIALAAADTSLALAKGAGPAAALKAGPDAALLGARADFEQSHQRLIEIYDEKTGVADDAEAESAADPLRARLAGLVDTMDGMSAQTEAGLRARMRLLSVYNGGDAWSWDDESTISGKLLRRVRRTAWRGAAHEKRWLFLTRGAVEAALAETRPYTVSTKLASLIPPQPTIGRGWAGGAVAQVTDRAISP